MLALLLPEAGGARARQLAVQRGGLPGYTSFFTFVEMEAAYARRLAEGSLTAETMARLRLHAQKIESALGVVWPDPEVLSDARRLVPELGLRPADALQLASARRVAESDPGAVFASLDERLNEAAQAAGLALPW
ncbi:MAG: type II toxin-antitoxin system VapC family toxin [Elusimicrobia bacterium]|nr:type II toxin-antitoxin system VapC family toxin [Elusimicrobiota bacterium]